MVVNVYPITYVLAGAVKLRFLAGEDVGDLSRDELLDVLVRAVVIGAVRYGSFDAKGPHPSADQVIGTCLSGRVWA